MSSDLKSRAVRECLTGLENAYSDRRRQILENAADLAASGVLDPLRAAQVQFQASGAAGGIDWCLRLIRVALRVLDDDGRTV